MKPSYSARRLALDMLIRVIEQGESLSAVTPRYLPRLSEARDRAFSYRLTFETLRQLNRLMWLRDQLLERPFKGKDSDVGLLLVLGIAQLASADFPEHASLNETVEVAKTLKKPWAIKLVNAVLRSFQRQKTMLLAKADADPYLAVAHPKWFVEAVKSAWGEAGQRVLTGNNLPARLCLRLSPAVDRDAYLAQLDVDLAAVAHPYLAQAILLNSTDVTRLPLFAEGGFAVQDANAQSAAHLLAPQAGERLLDACAAPGGKTAHLLALADNQVDMLALDCDEDRLARVQENLTRLGLTARLQVADAGNLSSWWQEEEQRPFDAILLDAPCSATGIIRRHPDIKWHRKPQDIANLVMTQAHLLDALWQTLAVGGRLLYATCSVLPAENQHQIQAFLARTPDAQQASIHVVGGIDTGFGCQLLPSQPDAGDGFFYALLIKKL
jgi:16S rRNA (cytosine967-C5)-methyltransferase